MYRVTLINDTVETVIHSELNSYYSPKVYEGTIKKAINKIDSFEFTLLPENKGYNLIQPLRTLVKVLNTRTNKLEFDGRVLMPTESMSDEGLFAKSFVCESELGYLNDSSQRHGEYHDISVKDFLKVIIDNHNADIAEDPIDKSFRVGIVDVDSTTGILYRYLGYEETLEAIKDKLLDRLGGELRIRKEGGIRYLDYLKEDSEHKSTEIRIARNLRSIQMEADPTEIITRLVPLGERIESEDEEATDASQARITIESVNGGKDFIEDLEAKSIYGVVTKSQSWDDISVPSILLTRGRQFLQENNRVKKKYDIDAYDLSLVGLDTDEFEVGNYYPVINPVMNIDDNLRVVEKTIDIVSPENNDLSMGDVFKTASDYQSEANRSQRLVTELESIVDSQSLRLASISKEVVDVEKNVKSVQRILEDADIEQLPEAVDALENAIIDLSEALEDIPVYGPVTQTVNGLMLAADKIKLDRITITQAVDLDQLYQDVQDLKNS